MIFDGCASSTCMSAASTAAGAGDFVLVTVRPSIASSATAGALEEHPMMNRLESHRGRLYGVARRARGGAPRRELWRSRASEFVSGRRASFYFRYIVLELCVPTHTQAAIKSDTQGARCVHNQEYHHINHLGGGRAGCCSRVTAHDASGRLQRPRWREHECGAPRAEHEWPSPHLGRRSAAACRQRQ